jgi:hypothetical protein
LIGTFFEALSQQSPDGHDAWRSMPLCSGVAMRDRCSADVGAVRSTVCKDELADVGRVKSLELLDDQVVEREFPASPFDSIHVNELSNTRSGLSATKASPRIGKNKTKCKLQNNRNWFVWSFVSIFISSAAAQFPSNVDFSLFDECSSSLVCRDFVWLLLRSAI